MDHLSDLGSLDSEMYDTELQTLTGTSLVDDSDDSNLHTTLTGASLFSDINESDVQTTVTGASLLSESDIDYNESNLQTLTGASLLGASDIDLCESDMRTTLTCASLPSETSDKDLRGSDLTMLTGSFATGHGTTASTPLASGVSGVESASHSGVSKLQASALDLLPGIRVITAVSCFPFTHY